MKIRSLIIRFTALLLLVVMMPLSAMAATYATIIAVNSLYLRAQPRVDGDEVGLYRYGKKVEILDSKTYRNWVRVKAPDGKTGYMYRSYLSAFTTAPETGTGTTRYITSSNGKSVNFRRRASVKSPLLDQLKVGTAVTVISSGATWTRIRYNNMDGWVQTKFLSKTRP